MNKDKRQFKRLAFKNQYVFGRVMQDEGICKGLIERILGITVTSIEYLNAKQVLEPTLYGKGSELDLYVRAKEGVFDIEMQTTPEDCLEGRFSYYQTSIYSEEFRRGKDYDELPRSIIIFICDYDPFGYGLPIYEIQPTCKGLGFGKLDFRQKWYALNCPAWEGIKDKPLQNLFRYVSEGKVTQGDRLVTRIDTAVNEANDDESWLSGVYAVNHTIEDAERRARIAVRSAHRKGMAEGEAKGRQEGLAEGLAEGEAKGRKEGENLLKLNEALLAAGRIDDLKRATGDKEYRQTLLAELGIS